MAKSKGQRKEATRSLKQPGDSSQAVDVVEALAQRLAQLGKREWQVIACRLWHCRNSQLATEQ